MIDNQASDNPEVATQDSGVIKSYSNIEELLPQIAEKKKEAMEAEEEGRVEEGQRLEEVEQPEEAQPDSGEETEAEAKESEPENVLSQFDFNELDGEYKAEFLSYMAESMSDEDKASFAEAIGSGAGKEAAKLRKELAKLKEREEEVRKSAQSLVPNDNPFRNITSEDDLVSQEKDIRADIGFLSDTLRAGAWEENDKGEEGKYIKAGGQEQWFSKDQLWNMATDFQEKLTRIPERKMQIREERLAQEKVSRKKSQLKESFEWMADEDSPEFKDFESITNDPDFVLAQSMVPTLGAKLLDLAAFYAKGKNVKESKKPKAFDFKKKNKETVRNIKPSGAARAAGGNGPDKGRSEFRSKLFSGEIDHRKFGR